MLRMTNRLVRWPTGPAAMIVALSACAPAAAIGTLHAQESQLLYACNQEEATVSVIDMASNSVIRTVDLQTLGFSPTAKPHHTAVERDGSYWYLSLIGESKVIKFDRDDHVVAEADFETPGMLVLDPTSDRLYVGRSMSAVNPPSRIGVIRRSDMSIEEVDVFFPRPHALAISPDGRYVYTASLGQNQIAAYDVGADAVELTDVPGPTHSFVQFAIAPDGRTMVVGGELSGKVLVFDLTADPAHPTLEATLDVAAAPWHPVFTPDGRFVYVGNQRGNQITVIDVAARRVASVIAGPELAMPHGSAVSPNGRHVYVSNRHLRSMAMGGQAHADHGPPENGTVVVVDTETHTIVKEITVGRGTSGLGTRASH